MTRASYRVAKSTSKSSAKKSKGLLGNKVPPRQDSPSANDPLNCTSQHPDQTHWSWENLPDILYQLNPDKEEKPKSDPGLMRNSIFGKRLRNLPVLPDQISSTVEEFRVEAWQRLDPRISLEDITDRMHPFFRIKNNALQQRGVRFRQAFNIKAWRSGNKRSALLEAGLFKRMGDIGLDINSNSTRGITPGLIDPQLGEAGGRVPLPKGWHIRKLGAANSLKKQTEATFRELETLSENGESFVSSDFGTTRSGETEVMSEDPEVLPEATEVIKDEAPSTIEYFYQKVNYDEEQTHFGSSLPVICGMIPDNQLPDTVSLPDLDLRLGHRPPTPQIKAENDSLPLIYNEDRVDWRSPFWMPGSVVSKHIFCQSPCFDDLLMQEDEYLNYNPPLFIEGPSKLATPTTGIFPVITPIELNTLPEQQRWNIFDHMLAEYNKGERYVPEMPY
ncbi:uncharacterized protein DSM5745_05606 [Aspergillus mulundensis]|uniref:Uncharacterized protein n=1 Tax=Aspergillus mulundensis TaxID=1810919 RepID=A0A3D8RY26_9EURO|nr:hypothetical protein DSM5745_05606 [Aspergillus mulundensis]RDW78754.1 hypothetical protein DSM5745_05606 [Aspergillus mulundensis]